MDPSLALRPGRFDGLALSIVWCIRRASFPLLLIGLIGAAVGGELDDLDPQQFQSMGQLFEALVSPLAGVVLAIVARVGAAWLGWVLAWPLARAAGPVHDGRSRRSARFVGRWLDLFYLTRALRAWRWTAPVRQLAADRLGETGRLLRKIDVALLVATPILVVALFVVLAIIDARQGTQNAIAYVGPVAVASGARPDVSIRSARTDELSR